MVTGLSETCGNSVIVLKSANKCKSGINSLALRNKSFSSECLFYHDRSRLSVSLKQEESTSITRENCAVWVSRGSRRSPARKENCLLTLMSPINKSVTDIGLSGVVYSEVNGLKGKLGGGLVHLKNLGAY